MLGLSKNWDIADSERLSDTMDFASKLYLHFTSIVRHAALYPILVQKYKQKLKIDRAIKNQRICYDSEIKK